MPRYTLDFNKEINDILQKLAKENEVTKAEIIRRALVTYAYLRNETTTGSKVSISDPEDNVVKDVILP